MEESYLSGPCGQPLLSRLTRIGFKKRRRGTFETKHASSMYNDHSLAERQWESIDDAVRYKLFSYMFQTYKLDGEREMERKRRGLSVDRWGRGFFYSDSLNTIKASN